MPSEFVLVIQEYFPFRLAIKIFFGMTVPLFGLPLGTLLFHTLDIHGNEACLVSWTKIVLYMYMIFGLTLDIHQVYVFAPCIDGQWTDPILTNIDMVTTTKKLVIHFQFFNDFFQTSPLKKSSKTDVSTYGVSLQ